MKFQRERSNLKFFLLRLSPLRSGGFLAPIIGAARLACIGLFGTAFLAFKTPSVTYAGGLIPLILLDYFKESAKVFFL